MRKGFLGVLSFAFALTALTSLAQPVSGPLVSTNRGVPVFTQTNGKKIDPSPVYIDATGNLYFGGPGTVIVNDMTTAERNLLSATNGMVIYNTSAAKLQMRENGAWVDIGTSAATGVFMSNFDQDWFRTNGAIVRPALGKTLPSWINVADVAYGAVGNGTDQTVPIKAAYDAINKLAPSPLYFPPGDWVFNLTVTNANITVMFGDGNNDFTSVITNRVRSALASTPVITVKAKGFKMFGGNFIGGNTNDSIGLAIVGGAILPEIHGMNSINFETNVLIRGDTSGEATSARFYGGTIQPASIAGSRGLYLQAQQGGTNYTSDTKVFGTKFYGVASGAGAKLIEVDGTDLQLNGVYLDMIGGFGVLTSKSAGTNVNVLDPIIDNNGVEYDSPNGTDIILTSWTANRTITDVLTGNYTFDGRWETAGGIVMQPETAAAGLRLFGRLNNPMIHGPAHFVDVAASTNNVAIGRIYGSGSGFWLDNTNGWMYLNPASFIGFASGASEIMRMDSVGLGIGTTTPSEKLSVHGSVSISNVANAQVHRGTNRLELGITTTGNLGYTPGLMMDGTLPAIHINETDAPINARRWTLKADAGVFAVQLWEDGMGAANNAIEIYRTAVAPAVRIRGDGEAQILEGVTTAYLSFYPATIAGGQKGFIGGAVAGSSNIFLYSTTGDILFGATNNLKMRLSPSGLLVVGDAVVDYEIYDATGWDADLSVPTKDAVRDKIEALVFGNGETNTASNLGAQSATVQGLFKSKSALDLQFRSIEAGANITLTSNANSVTITSTGGGGGGGAGSLTGSKAMAIIDLGGGMWQATNGFTFSGSPSPSGFSGYIEIGFLVTNATDSGSAVWTYGFVVQKDGTYSVNTEGFDPEVNGTFAVAVFDDGGTFSGDASSVTSSISLSGLDVAGPPLSVTMFYRIHQFGVGTIDGVDYSGGEGGFFVNGASVSSPNFQDTAATGTVPAATVGVTGTNFGLTIGPASLTEAGVVTTGTQRFGGPKTFDNINVTNVISAQSVTVSNLSGSLPVQSDGADGLVSEAINLASTDVTGILALGNLASGYSFANLGTGTNAALMAGNFKNTISEKADIETISGATPTVNWQTQPIKSLVVTTNISFSDANRPTAAAVGEQIAIFMTNSVATPAAISVPSGWRDETGIGFTNLVAGQTATITAWWTGTEVRYYWRTFEYPYDTVLTGAFALATTDHGKLFNNLGASSLTTYTLPAADAGLSFEFAVADTDGIQITSIGNDTIRIGGSVTAVAASVQNLVIGGTLKLTAINSTNWYGLWSQGTWTF